MRKLKNASKKVFGKLTGYRVESFGARSLALIDRARPADAWFSYRTQLKLLIDKFMVDLVIDVGANEGQFGHRMRELYAGEIISFEPVQAVFQRLAEASAGDPLWRAQQVALGSQDCTQTINVSRESVFSSLLQANEYARRRFNEEALQARQESISIRRGDELLNELVPEISARRLFLKMDTQGFDLEVFRGLETLLGNVVVLQSEISCIPIYEGMPHWTDVISLYEKAGFAVAGLFPISWDSDRIIEYDCLMIRAN